MKKVLLIVTIVIPFLLVGQVTYNPSIDGYMKSDQSGNGTSSYLSIGKSGSVEYRSVIKFDLSDIPSSDNVTSAILKLYRGGTSTAPNGSIYAYRATDSWSESNITWGNPDYNNSSYDSNSGGSTWMEWDITNLVQQWVDGTYTNYGVYLKATSSVSQLYEYYSKDYSTSAYRPKLVVELESTVPFEVTEPDDNTVWQQGEENVDINWETGNYGGNVSIHLWRNNNSIYTIISSTSNDGSYGSWDVPVDCPAGTNYYVRIQTLSPTPYYVAESEYFEIEEMGGIIEVTQPNNSTTWSLGQENVPITWETGNIPGEVKIELFKQTFTTPVLTITSSTSNSGSFNWNVPTSLTPGTNYKVKVTSLYNSAKNDLSDYFEIAYDPTPIATITSIQQSENDVDPGDSFLLTIMLKNTGDALATNGGISVSFPDFTATNQWGSSNGYMSEHGTVLSQPANTTLSIIEAFGYGETIYNSSGNTMTAQYLLFEGSKENWSINEEQTLMLVITPQVPGELNMKIRGWFQYENNGLSVDPGGSGSGIGIDQQGFYTYEEAITVNQVLPDLTINQINTPSTVDPGGTYDMSYIIKNIGNQQAPLSASEVRISQTQNFNDGIVVANYNTPVLDINETWSSPTFPFTVPNNFFGNNYILVKADAAALINELDENNNIGIQPLYITTPLAIQVNSPSSNVIVSQGDDVNIQWVGSGEPGSAVLIKYDLDNIWDNGNETTIAYNQSLSGSYSWETDNISPGTYNIGCSAYDADGFLYDYAPGAVTIAGAYNIELTLYRISDTDDTPNDDTPGTEKTSFIPGETVRVTMKAENTGASAPVQCVLNIMGPSGTPWYDSHALGEDNTTDSPLNNGEMDYYSFDWTIPDDFTDFGDFDLGGSIRNLTTFDDLYETTCNGSNTGFGCEWVLEEVFEIVSAEDNTPPEIEVWKVYQTGDLKFHILARITDNGVGVNPSTVKVKYRKYPGNWNTIGRTKTMIRVPDYNDFYEVEVSPDYPFNFDNGDAAIFKLEAKDYNGNINKYPESKPCIDVHETDPDFGNYCGRMFIWDEDHLNSENTFQYNNFGSGAISYRMNGDDIKIYNNTSIWYTMETVPEGLNVEQTGLWSTTMLTPKSGLLPLNRDDWFGDRSVSIFGPIDEDFITIKSNRKSTNAIIRNTWDMVWIALKPKLPDIPNDRIQSIIQTVTDEIDLYNTLQAINNRDYYEIVSICIDEIFDEDTQTILVDRITQELVNQGFSGAEAFSSAFKVVSGAWDIITGINNRIAFVKDVFIYPWDTDEFSMSKTSPLYIDEIDIPGTVNSNGAVKFFINENTDFLIPVHVPSGNTQSYFQTYALVNLYSPEGELIETTYISDYDYDLQGYLDVKQNDFCVDQGAEWNSQRFNNAIPIKVEYDFTQSSLGHNFQSNIKPYYIEVKFYQGGLPDLGISPYEPDELINTGLVPFRIFDHVDPIKPAITHNSADNNPLQIGFVVIPAEKDIDYYNVFRKIENESSFIQVDSILNGGKEELYFYDQFNDSITSVESLVSTKN